RAVAMRNLRRENTLLQLHVRERTAELEIANRELDAFCYSVSHDLRAPLRAVDGFTNILLEDFAPELSPGARELLDRVVASARHMGQLIDDLLRLSQVGRQALSKRTVNMAAEVRRILGEL